MSKSTKKVVVAALLVMVSYFMFSALYILVFDRQDSLGDIMATVGAFGVAALYYWYVSKKAPEVIMEMKIEQHDEREIMIRQKAGHVTLYVLFAGLFIITGVANLMNNLPLLLISGGTYILALIVYLSLIRYYKHKN